VESVRIYRQRSEAENRERWIDFHRNMHRLHSSLAAEHEAQVGKLCEEDRGEGLSVE
jgi:hypothetical protein